MKMPEWATAKSHLVKYQKRYIGAAGIGVAAAALVYVFNDKIFPGQKATSE